MTYRLLPWCLPSVCDRTGHLLRSEQVHLHGTFLDACPSFRRILTDFGHVQSSKAKVDGSLIATILETASVFMLFLGWKSITEGMYSALDRGDFGSLTGCAYRFMGRTMVFKPITCTCRAVVWISSSFSVRLFLLSLFLFLIPVTLLGGDPYTTICNIRRDCCAILARHDPPNDYPLTITCHVTLTLDFLPLLP